MQRNLSVVGKTFLLSFVTLLICGLVEALDAAQLTNTILFVTQVPVPNEINDNVITNVFLGVGAGFGNHLGDTAHAPRGGDLWLRKSDGSLTNLTRGLGFGVAGAQHTNGIAVRQPHVHWDGTRALFGMVVGAPKNAADTNNFFWQLYEITGLPNGPYAITKITGQPTNCNNVSPCYLPDGKIVFASDQPRDGSVHLYPQLDEYNDFPTVTGLWSLDPATGDVHLLNHTPSGVFSPSVDSFGRLIFVRWDHLVQDRNATVDRIITMTNGAPTNGTFNYVDESANSTFNFNDRSENFPEPRTFDSTNIAALKVNGNAFNSFFPWAMFLDGTSEEVLNHLGRHDFMQSFNRSYTNDNNLVNFNIATRTNLAGFPTNLFPNYVTNFIANCTNYLSGPNFFWMREDPARPGVYFGVDTADFGTHAAGQILTITAPPALNPDFCFLTYITPKNTGFPNTYGAYRNPLPLSNGVLVASFATNTTALDSNIGTPTAPQSRYNFRLYALTNSGLWYVNQPLNATAMSNNVSQYVNGQLVTYNGPLWEFDPVEVIGRLLPQTLTNSINVTELQVFDEEGVDVSLFQKYLRVNNLALIVSHNVTKRDRADTQQPFNLRISGTTNVTVKTGSNTNNVYDIAHIQFLQADQRRGYRLGSGSTAPGRRILATPLHEPAADNVLNPIGPNGSLKLGDDGSFAALLPARRAMTWQLIGTNILANTNSIVKERYWVTFQPGEIRTCKNCHGINSTDQAGANGGPNNKPQALRDLLRYWKTNSAVLLGTTTSGGSNFLTLTFNRRVGVSNVTHTVQLSDDLTNWFGGSVYSATGNVPNTVFTSELNRTGTNTETIIVRENFPIGTVPQRYLRVRVSSP